MCVSNTHRVCYTLYEDLHLVQISYSIDFCTFDASINPPDL